MKISLLPRISKRGNDNDSICMYLSPAIYFTIKCYIVNNLKVRDYWTVAFSQYRKLDPPWQIYPRYPLPHIVTYDESRYQTNPILFSKGLNSIISSLHLTWLYSGKAQTCSQLLPPPPPPSPHTHRNTLGLLYTFDHLHCIIRLLCSYTST